jgi:hypothetical protein
MARQSRYAVLPKPTIFYLACVKLEANPKIRDEKFVENDVRSICCSEFCPYQHPAPYTFCTMRIWDDGRGALCEPVVPSRRLIRREGGKLRFRLANATEPSAFATPTEAPTTTKAPIAAATIRKTWET